MNVLWVENHASFVAITHEFLDEHRVSVTPSLAGARLAFSCESFDVVVVDFDLDDGKGEDLVLEVRALPSRPWIIAASAHDAGNNALVAAGADRVCGKMKFTCIRDVLSQMAEQRPESLMQ